MPGKPRFRSEKLEAVQMYLDNRDAKETAKLFGVHYYTLLDWVKEFEATGDLHEPRNTLAGQSEEMKELRRMNRRVTVSAALEPKLADWVCQRAARQGVRVSQYLRALIIRLYRNVTEKERGK